MRSELPTSLLESLYRHETAPWAVLLLAQMHTVLAQPLPTEDRKPYIRLNDALRDWWPNRQRLLRDIYWQELAACWQAYDRLPDDQVALIQCSQQLMTCGYLQLLILRRYEEMLNAAAPALPNDLKMYSIRDFVALVDGVMQRLPAAQHKGIVEWLIAVNAAPVEYWLRAGADIDCIMKDVPMGTCAKSS